MSFKPPTTPLCTVDTIILLVEHPLHREDRPAFVLIERKYPPEGWALPESWSGYSQHSVDTLPLPTKHISASEVLRFRDDAFNRHFADPRYFEMLEKTFGEKAVAEVRAMTAVSITRRFA